MSEHLGSQPDDESVRKLFENLEAELTDPYLTEMHMLARTEERKIAQSADPTEADRTAAVKRLDGAWGPYNHQPMQVSGTLVYQTGSGSLETVQVSALDVISNGFDFRPEPIIHDDEVIGHRWQVGHSVITTYGRDDMLSAIGFMPLDGIISIHLPFDSAKQRISRFAQSYPKEAEYIRAAMGRGLRHALDVLAHYAISIDTRSEVQREDIKDRLSYLQEMLGPEVDRILPCYVVTLEGDYRSSREGSISREYTHTAKSMLIALESFGLGMLQQECDETGRTLPHQTYQLVLQATRHPSDRHLSTEQLIIPASSITAIESIRDLAYYTAPE